MNEMNDISIDDQVQNETVREVIKQIILVKLLIGSYFFIQSKIVLID